MIISEVYPDYVWTTISSGNKVDAVDFKKKTYVELGSQTIDSVNFLISRAKTDNDVKFFKIESGE